jgi:hypothetical protein
MYYCTDDVRVVSTPFHPLDPNSESLCLVPLKSLLVDGIVVLVTRLVILFIMPSLGIMCHVLSLVVQDSMYVMPVHVPRLTNFPIQCPLVVLQLL